MIVRELNKLLAEKMEGVEWVEKKFETPKCKKHPKWAMKGAPTTKKGVKGCICHEIWAAKKSAVPEYEPVLTDQVKFFGSECMQEVVRQLYKFPEEYKVSDAERSFLSASKVGQCVYKSCLDKLGSKPEPLSVRSKLTFMFGGILEALYRYLLRTCEFEGFRFIEVPALQNVTIGGETQRGYYDGVVEVHWKRLHAYVGGSEEFWSDLVKKTGKEHFRVLFEMKTKSDYGYKDAQRTKTIGMKYKGRGSKRQLERDDPFGYRAQMGIYLRQAYADGVIDIPLGIWFVVSKNTGAAIDIPVALKQLEYDIELAEQNYVTVADVVRNNKPLPPRPFNLSANGNIPRFPCGYCEQKFNCWSDEPVDSYEIADVDAEKVQYRPVWKSEPTIWLELEFDGKGQPVWMVMEGGGNDIPEGEDDE